MPKYLEVDELGSPAAQLFGERLKERRRACDMTQAQLAEQTDITAAYISLIERGRANPTLEMMVKLAETVGAKVWDMIRPAE